MASVFPVGRSTDPQTLEGKAPMKSQVPPCHEAGLCCLIVLVLTPKRTSALRSAQDVLSCLTFTGKDPDRIISEWDFFYTVTWGFMARPPVFPGLGNKKRKKEKNDNETCNSLLKMTLPSYRTEGANILSILPALATKSTQRLVSQK